MGSERSSRKTTKRQTTTDTDMFDTMVETPTLRYASISLSHEGKATRGIKKCSKDKGQIASRACCGQGEGGGAGCLLF